MLAQKENRERNRIVFRLKLFDYRRDGSLASRQHAWKNLGFKERGRIWRNLNS
jgi:hypothetical protein